MLLSLHLLDIHDKPSPATAMSDDLSLGGLWVVKEVTAVSYLHMPAAPQFATWTESC